MSEETLRQLHARVRAIPDFPVKGILFRDITPVFQDARTFASTIQMFVETYRYTHVDAFAGIESRGFLFAAPIALELGASFVPIRKKGRLPAATVECSYQLEYGEATLEMHRDALKPGDRVVIVDDLLATGGTAKAACNLVEQLEAHVVDLAFLIELEALGGRQALEGRSVTSFLNY
jgi:adenine phosphoribosyltransferase